MTNVDHQGMRRLRGHRGRIWAARPVVTLSLVVALACAVSARAEEPGSLPEDVPAADQYVESLPTSDGPRDPKTGNGRSAPLPARAAQQLRRLGGESAEELKRTATSPELGAPQRKLRGGRDASAPGALSGVLSGVDAGGGELVWLAVALVVITGLGLGAAGYRYRRRGTGR